MKFLLPALAGPAALFLLASENSTDAVRFKVKCQETESSLSEREYSDDELEKYTTGRNKLRDVRGLKNIFDKKPNAVEQALIAMHSHMLSNASGQRSANPSLGSKSRHDEISSIQMHDFADEDANPPSSGNSTPTYDEPNSIVSGGSESEADGELVSRPGMDVVDEDLDVEGLLNDAENSFMATSTAGLAAGPPEGVTNVVASSNDSSSLAYGSGIVSPTFADISPEEVNQRLHDKCVTASERSAGVLPSNFSFLPQEFDPNLSFAAMPGVENGSRGYSLSQNKGFKPGQSIKKFVSKFDPNSLPHPHACLTIQRDPTGKVVGIDRAFQNQMGDAIKKCQKKAVRGNSSKSSKQSKKESSNKRKREEPTAITDEDILKTLPYGAKSFNSAAAPDLMDELGNIIFKEYDVDGIEDSITLDSHDKFFDNCDEFGNGVEVMSLEEPQLFVPNLSDEQKQVQELERELEAMRKTEITGWSKERKNKRRVRMRQLYRHIESAYDPAFEDMLKLTDNEIRSGNPPMSEGSCVRLADLPDGKELAEAADKKRMEKMAAAAEKKRMANEKRMADAAADAAVKKGRRAFRMERMVEKKLGLYKRRGHGTPVSSSAFAAMPCSHARPPLALAHVKVEMSHESGDRAAACTKANTSTIKDSASALVDTPVLSEEQLDCPACLEDFMNMHLAATGRCTVEGVAEGEANAWKLPADSKMSCPFATKTITAGQVQEFRRTCTKNHNMKEDHHNLYKALSHDPVAIDELRAILLAKRAFDNSKIDISEAETHLRNRRKLPVYMSLTNAAKIVAEFAGDKKTLSNKMVTRVDNGIKSWSQKFLKRFPGLDRRAGFWDVFEMAPVALHDGNQKSIGRKSHRVQWGITNLVEKKPSKRTDGTIFVPYFDNIIGSKAAARISREFVATLLNYGREKVQAEIIRLSGEKRDLKEEDVYALLHAYYPVPGSPSTESKPVIDTRPAKKAKTSTDVKIPCISPSGVQDFGTGTATSGAPVMAPVMPGLRGAPVMADSVAEGIIPGMDVVQDRAATEEKIVGGEDLFNFSDFIDGGY